MKGLAGKRSCAAWASQAIHHADAPMISALAATGAAVAAATVAAIQLYVGHRQSKAALISADAALKSAENAGRHKVAESRQAWINNVIDTISEHHSIASTIQPGQKASLEDDRRLSGLRTKLTILLNPDEPHTVALVKAIEEVDKSQTDAEFAAAESEMLTVARQLLKREWVRIKDELK